MTSFSVSQLFAFVALFLAGKLFSLWVYQVCWSNGRRGRFGPWGVLATLLRKPAPWLVHLPILLFTSGHGWDHTIQLRWFATVTTAVIAVGSVGRFGAVDLGRFFVADRILVVALSIGVYFHPVFVYPALLAACCLQYIVSSWQLGPGYSNLLGFEFARGSACVLAACLCCRGFVIGMGIPPATFEPLAFAVLLGFQASTYVNNALAKAALGEHWFSWMFKNRVQCLVVNAYLRGWCANVVSTAFALQFARLAGLFRIPFCGAAFAIELGFLSILTRVEICIGMLVSATGFHITVFLLTGLLELEYVVNHVTLCWLMREDDLANVFSVEYVAGLLLCAAVSFAWVGWLRLRILDAYQKFDFDNRLMRLADAADLLMAWWDSPYMRMFSYTAVTESGRKVNLPACQMSPYDTALTDIHTHIMLLNRHQGLDPQTEADGRIARTGVWGLVGTTAERDRLYRWMDQPAANLDPLRSSGGIAAWHCRGPDDGPQVAFPLWRYFDSINRYQCARWFQIVMRWPHFPGEDLVPDTCPLMDDSHERYRFDEPLVQVTLSRIKTFYDGEQIFLIEHSVVGTFEFAPPTKSQ